MPRPFRTFIGVDLGGGKGKTTALTRLRWELAPGGSASPDSQASPGEAGGLGAPLEPLPPESLAGSALVVEDCGGSRPGLCPWYDQRLVEYLLSHREAVVAMDAPLTLTACVRCQLPVCPGLKSCQVPAVRWFRERGAAFAPADKPKYTPYTQRATEVVLHEDHGIMPRETLGQGMGPLTARMAYLRRALSRDFVLNQNLLEVYPKATLTQLFPDPEPALPAGAKPLGIGYRDGNGRPIGLDGKVQPRLTASQVARLYKRSGHALPMRERVLSELATLAGVGELRFGPGQWREFALQSDHQFDSLICAFTAFLWSTRGWQLPAEPVFQEDGWIWFPPRRVSTLAK